MNDLIIRNFIRIIISKMFESVDDVDQQIFEFTGIIDFDDMVAFCVNRVLTILTEQQKIELEQDSKELINLCSMYRCATNDIDISLANDNINKFVFEMFDKILNILRNYNER